MPDPRPPVPLLRTIEGLRFIAAAGIACIHILPHVGLVPPGTFDLFVDLFFVVSGIVIGSLYVGRIRTAGDYGRFLRRRFARIYPLHLATLLFYVALGAVIVGRHLPVDDPGRFDPRQILPNLLLVQAWFPWGTLSYNFVAWSISAEAFVYLLFPVIALAVATGRDGGLAAVGAMLAAALWIAAHRLGAPLFELRWNGGVLRALPSFAFGVWISLYARDSFPTLARHARSLFHATATLFLIGLFAGFAGYLMLALAYILVTAGYIADLAGQPTIVAAPRFSALGRYTYSIYMLHVPVTTVFLSFLLPRLLGHGPMADLLAVTLTCLILAIVSAASFHLFENPLRKRLGGGAGAKAPIEGGTKQPIANRLFPGAGDHISLAR